jgi:hypothetical protein
MKRLLLAAMMLMLAASAWAEQLVTASTAVELIEAIEAHNQGSGRTVIELLPIRYELPEALPRISRGDLEIEGAGAATVIDGSQLTAFGETPLAFTSPAAFDILASDVGLQRLTVENWDVGVRVTDGVAIGFYSDNPLQLVWCPPLPITGASVSNIVVEDVAFRHVFAAYRATTNGGNGTTLAALKLGGVSCDDVVECILVSNDCGATGTLIEVEIEGATITNLHPEPAGGEFGLTGVGVAIGGLGPGSGNTVIGRVDGAMVSDSAASVGYEFSGGSFGATSGKTIIELSNTAAQNIFGGYALIGGTYSAGGSLLDVTLDDAHASEVGREAMAIIGSQYSGNNVVQARIKGFDASAPDSPFAGVFVTGGFPNQSAEIELDISDARIDFEDAFFLIERFFAPGGNSIRLHLTDVQHCGSGVGLYRFEVTPGAIEITLDGNVVSGNIIDLPTCD